MPLRRPDYRPPATDRPHRLRCLRELAAGGLLAAVVALSAVPARGQQVPDVVLDQHRRVREQQYKSVRNSTAAMPPLAAATIDDVLRLRVEDGHLVYASPVKIKDEARTGQFRVDLPRFKGPTYVQVTMTYTGVARVLGAPPPPPVAQRMVTFISYEMPSPDELTTLTVQGYPTSVHVTRTTQTNEGTRTVRLTDERAADGRTGAVRLFSTEFRQDGRPGQNVNFEADDFHTLLRKHPRAAEELIRPLLRTLGQEGVFAPEPGLAWQVLSDWWRPDDAVRRRVDALLPAMRNPNFRAREQAVVALQALGRGGAAVLRGMDRSGLTPEQNLLIDRALAPFNVLALKDAERLRNDPTFLIDCLNSPDAEVRAAAVDRLTHVLGRAVRFDHDALLPDRTAAVEALRREHLAHPATRPAKE